MIEAVENHMPEVIIIDEIGTELEAMAASTIAQRGVQLVGTAHGVTIESIIKNPCLQALVGGIEVGIIISFIYFILLQSLWSSLRLSYFLSFLVLGFNSFQHFGSTEPVI